MNKIIGVTELQRNFKSVFDQVVHDHVPYVLTRGSRPEAVIIPYEQYMKYVRAEDQGVHARFDALLERMAKANAKYSDQEVARDLEDVTLAVRARRRLREKKEPYRKTKAAERRGVRAKK